MTLLLHVSRSNTASPAYNLSYTPCYVGKYEKEVRGINKKEVCQLNSHIDLLAPHVRQNNSAGLFYVHTNPVGITIRVSKGKQEKVYKAFYDAWGKQLFDQNNTSQTDPLISIGYTAHEHIPAFNLIDMKGRFYDPQISQMLSPDPIISEIENAQTYNKYSYVFNNPLKYTDPTGYFGVNCPGDFSLEEEKALREKEERELRDFINNLRSEGVIIGNEMVVICEQNSWWYKFNKLFENLLEGISSEQGGGGSDFWSTTAGLINSYTSPKADFVGGAAENKIGQILLDRGKYGSLHPETIIRTPVANISVSTKLLQNTGTALKWGGRVFGFVGLLGTYAQYRTGAIGGSEAALDATFGAIGFVPGYGWAVSAAYFLIAKPLYNYSIKP